MRILLLLSIFIISSTISNKAIAQIIFSGCVDEGLTPSYTLNETGSITDDGIVRTVFESNPAGGNYGEVIIIKWDPTEDRWNILHNSFDGGDGLNNELLYSSAVATYPNPPNIAIGNWTNLGADHDCDPMSVLTGDVEVAPPGINIDPTLTGLPTEITITEDAQVANPISEFDISDANVDDVDLGAGELTMSLRADGGVFSLAAPGGPFTLGGNGTSRITITGTLAQVNGYIDQPTNIYYLPERNLSGDNATSIEVYINDNGNTGTGGGNDIFAGLININITAVNDAPEISVPNSISVTEGSNTALTGISFVDVDAGSENVTVVMSVGAGTITAVSGGGVTITGGGTSINFNGAIANINAFIAGSNLTYQNEPGNTADQTLSIAVNDNGNTGSGGSLSDNATTTIAITPNLAEVTSVALPVDGTYGGGENLDFVVNFDEDVIVETSGGTPRLSTTIGASTRYANYTSGSGTSSLLFRYTIQQGDEDSDGIALGSNALTTNGGTIQNDNTDANLTLQNIGSTANVLVDAVAPSGYSVAIDQVEINATNESAVSFSLSGAEVGANYTYTFSSSGGGTNVTGSGTVSTATDQISGIDLSGLNDGTITLTLSLEDSFGNIGAPVTTTSIKNINEAPIAVEDEFSTDVNTILTGNLLTNDSDPNTDALTASLVTAPVNGTIVLNADGSFTYTPNANYVGLDSLMYKVCDNGTPSLCVNTVEVRFEIVDTTIPTGYSVSWDDNLINASEASATAFTVSDVEIGTTLNYTLSSSGDGNNQTISGTESITDSSMDYIVDVSNLEDGTLTAVIFLTSIYGTPGANSSDSSALLDKTAPSGYAVSIDQDPIDGSNHSLVSFTFSGAEVGASYNYSFIGETAGSSITGSGTVTASNQQVSGIDLSTLANGTITLSTSLEDPAGNTGVSVTDTGIKETNNTPTASDVTVTGALSVGEQLSGDYTFSDLDGDIESGSTFLWYRSDDESGVGKTEISGAVSNQYTLQSADRGKYISFTVTPNDGIIDGLAVESALVGPVKIDQTITFSNIEVKTYGDAPFILGDAQTDQGLTVNYTATDPSIVEITGNQATILKAGITSIAATQVGNDQTNPALAVEQTLTVNKAMLSVTADASSKTYGDPDPEFTYQVSGFVNGDDIAIVTGTLSRATGEDAGNYPITLGNLSGGTNYELHLEAADFEILKADQEITWDQDLSFGCDSDSQLSLTASASSRLPVTYTVTDTSIAEVTGDVLSANASGSTTIIAEQPGDENHHPATSVEKVVSVSQNGLIRQHWDDVLVFDNSSSDFVSYQWYKNGAPVAGATKQYYSENGTLRGSYYAEATTQSGEVIISCVLELSGEHFTKSVRLVPNPASASSEFIVDCSFDEATLSGASISVIDLNGRLMQTVSVTGSQTSLTAPTQRGVYVVVLSLADGPRKTVNLLVN